MLSSPRSSARATRNVRHHCQVIHQQSVLRLEKRTAYLRSCRQRLLNIERTPKLFFIRSVTMEPTSLKSGITAHSGFRRKAGRL